METENRAHDIILPAIRSGRIYLFTTGSGVDYEVRFGRKQDDVLKATIIFGVTNDEYEGEDYSLTNKGELYRVMSTMVKIVQIFMAEHPLVNYYEFTGLSKPGEDDSVSNARINLYRRYVPQIFDNTWKMEYNGNKIIAIKSVTRK